MATAAYEYLRGLYGGDVQPKVGLANLTAVNSSVAGGNPEAVTVTFINTGAAPCYLWWDNTVAANNGIPIQAGGLLSMSVERDAILPTLDWHAVAPAGNTTLAFIYTIRINKVGG